MKKAVAGLGSSRYRQVREGLGAVVVGGLAVLLHNISTKVW